VISERLRISAVSQRLVEEVLERLSIERFALQEFCRHQVQLIAMGSQDSFCLSIRTVQHLPDLLIDGMCRLLTAIAQHDAVARSGKRRVLFCAQCVSPTDSPMP
jgi:hypothetical protein